MYKTGLELETNVSTLAVNQATGRVPLGIVMPDVLYKDSGLHNKVQVR